MTKVTLTDSEKSSRMEKLLEEYYTCREGHEVVFELRAGTGYGRGRGYESRVETRFDALVVGSWNSTEGIKGFELKASRSDFLLELKDPNKRKPLEAISSECWFLTWSGVVKSPTEIPEGWGWMEVRADTDVVVKVAAKQKAQPSIPYTLFASLARRADVVESKETKDPWLQATRHRRRKFMAFEGKSISKTEVPQIVHSLLKEELDELMKTERRKAEETLAQLQKTKQELEMFKQTIAAGLKVSPWQISSPEKLLKLMESQKTGTASAHFIPTLKSITQQLESLLEEAYKDEERVGRNKGGPVA